MQRRAFLIGLGAALAAPAIVHASSLMPIFVSKPRVLLRLQEKNALGEWVDAGVSVADHYLNIADHDIFALMATRVMEAPARIFHHDQGARFVTDKATSEAMHLQAMKNRNVLLADKVRDRDGERVAFTWRGIPIDVTA